MCTSRCSNEEFLDFTPFLLYSWCRHVSMRWVIKTLFIVVKRVHENPNMFIYVETSNSEGALFRKYISVNYFSPLVSWWQAGDDLFRSTNTVLFLEPQFFHPPFDRHLVIELISHHLIDIGVALISVPCECAVRYVQYVGVPWYGKPGQYILDTYMKHRLYPLWYPKSKISDDISMHFDHLFCKKDKPLLDFSVTVCLFRGHVHTRKVRQHGCLVVADFGTAHRHPHVRPRLLCPPLFVRHVNKPPLHGCQNDHLRKNAPRSPQKKCFFIIPEEMLLDHLRRNASWSSQNKCFLHPFLWEWFSHGIIFFRVILWFISHWIVSIVSDSSAIILFWFPFPFLSRDFPTNAIFRWGIRRWGDAFLYTLIPINFAPEHRWWILWCIIMCAVECGTVGAVLKKSTLTPPGLVLSTGWFY